jgi:hypothetical protein
MEPTRARDLKLISEPHVVLLGAGASRAAFPDGDRNGKRLPLMSDFFDTVPEVRVILSSGGVATEGQNLEILYSELAREPSRAPLLQAVNTAINSYFSGLQITDAPTIYDDLLLSLRRKDVIATFNWDPLLHQAARRNPILKGRLPTINYLHGNVLFGYCHRDRRRGTNGINCSRCGKPFSESRLLYPVTEKDYSDPAIADAWTYLQAALRSARFITIFGYSAPLADQQARRLLFDAWGDPSQREVEQIEIIDVADEERLLQTWRPFIHTHHYEIHRDYSESWLARHPRRTVEAWRGQYLDVHFLRPDPLPKSRARTIARVRDLIRAEEYAALLRADGDQIL